MKLYILLLALLQSLGCSGFPAYNSELASAADRSLGAALAHVNSIYAVGHLYRVTRGSVTRVIPVGLNTNDLLMKFDIKETECAKTSRTDPQRCAFRPGFFVPSSSCSGRVRVSASATQVVSVRCGQDSSSSSESSSEEMFSRGRQQFNIPTFVHRDPTAPPPPVQPSRSFQSQPSEVRPRGDNFNNYLDW